MGTKVCTYNSKTNEISYFGGNGVLGSYLCNFIKKRYHVKLSQEEEKRIYLKIII